MKQKRAAWMAAALVLATIGLADSAAADCWSERATCSLGCDSNPASNSRGACEATCAKHFDVCREPAPKGSPLPEKGIGDAFLEALTDADRAPRVAEDLDIAHCYKLKNPVPSILARDNGLDDIQYRTYSENDQLSGPHYMKAGTVVIAVKVCPRNPAGHFNADYGYELSDGRFVYPDALNITWEKQPGSVYPRRDQLIADDLRKDDIDGALNGNGEAQCNIAIAYDDTRNHFIKTVPGPGGFETPVLGEFKFGRGELANKIKFWLFMARHHHTTNARCINWRGLGMPPGQI